MQILKIKAYVEHYQIKCKLEDSNVLERNEKRFKRAENRLRRAKNQPKTEESKLEVLESQLELFDSLLLKEEIAAEKDWYRICTKAVKGEISADTREILISLVGCVALNNRCLITIEGMRLVRKEILKLNDSIKEAEAPKPAKGKDFPSPKIEKVKEVNLDRESYPQRA